MRRIHIPQHQFCHKTLTYFLKWVRETGINLIESSKKQNDKWNDFINNNVSRHFKTFLAENQGFLCCYCGSPINKPYHVDIEHLRAREIAPTEMFDCDNLFASCSSNEHSQEYKVNEEDVSRFDKNVSAFISYLEERYFSSSQNLTWLNQRLNQWQPITTLKKMATGVRIRLVANNKNICNNAKGNKSIPFNLSDTLLNSFFEYDNDGTILATKFAPEGTQDALNNVLRLNEPFLKERRKQVKESIEEAFNFILQQYPLQEIASILNKISRDFETPNDYKELKPYYFVSLFVLEQYTL